MKLNYQVPKTTYLSLDTTSTRTKPHAVKPLAQSIRLSVITQFFPPDFAATGQLIEELVRQLGQQGVDVKVFTGQPGYAFQSTSAPAYEQAGLVQIKRSRTSQMWPKRIRGKAINGILFMIRAVLHLLKNCRRRNIVLITTAPPFLPIVGYLAHLLFGMSYICLLYDLYPDIAVELGVISRRHWLTRLWHALNEQVWKHADGIIVLSSAMQERVANRCPEVANKISVIHSWADSNTIVPIPKSKNWFAMKHRLIEPFTVLYSGNLGRCHDVDTMLEAAILLRDEPIQFVCIGNGAKREILIQKVQELGLTNFLFLPYQDRDVLPYSLTACDLSLVSVSPGMDSLVAPSKLYSALSAGRPIAVICPKQAYLNQVIAEAGCGATFENGDAAKLANFIRLLQQDRQTAERMGKAGRRYLQTHFTPEIIAGQYLTVLKQCVFKG
ncbi:glycosyltransferase family 4 protein [Leptolyngbya sp. NK1-12]|uniref:glycosyltransferase family 4 protein n=1 Tax=Leptolyngbya sp. NK1-12 TaxID=2547451 RepID=UPI00292D1578|nr:glycosyltransferase family 4 protein [Leptolyngbya sp. NK1-12]